MAVKAGQIIHVGNDVTVIDRVQSGGPGQLNIPTEKINELGNYKSVATIRDTPDLTFSLESYDTSTEVEALLTNAYAGRTVTTGAITAASANLTATGAAFTADEVGYQVRVVGAGTGGADLVSTILTYTSATQVTLADNAVTTVTGATVDINQNGIDLTKMVPVDIASQFKIGESDATPFAIVNSVALPYLYLESMGYRFGVQDNATQTASLRGDTIFYNAGPTYVQTAAGTNTPAQQVVTTNPAYESSEADARRVLSVEVDSTRLTLGVDYTESYGAITNGAATTTVTIADAVPTTSTIRIMYASPTARSFLQNVHPSSTVLPAAIRGKDIQVYIGGYDPNDEGAGSGTNRLLRVQSVTLDWRVNIEKDREMGNAYSIGQDFDVPAVTGTVDILPTNPAEVRSLIAKLAGVASTTQSLGASSAAPLALDIVIKNPADGEVLKRLHTPDARFTMPGYQARVQSKLSLSLNFESDTGDFKVYRY